MTVACYCVTNTKGTCDALPAATIAKDTGDVTGIFGESIPAVEVGLAIASDSESPGRGQCISCIENIDCAK
jgi:hypothetical protein